MFNFAVPAAPSWALATLCLILLPTARVLVALYSRYSRRSITQSRVGGRGFILINKVTHARLLPADTLHSFTYPVLSLFVALSALESHSLDCGSGRLFGYGGIYWKMTGLRPSAYLQACGDGGTIKQKLKTLLHERGHDEGAFEDAWMLTMPSYVGFEGINPLTVYFCYDHNETPTYVVLEIHNTFGERHAHILRLGVAEDDVCAKGYEHQWTFAREFHVSPFNDRSGFYRVSVTLPPNPPSSSITEMCEQDSLHPIIQVHLYTGNTETFPAQGLGPLKLTAVLRPQSLIPLTSINLLRALLKHPFLLFLSLPRILYQAWILHYKKHLSVFPRPEPHPAASRWPQRNKPSGGVGWQSETWLQSFARRRAVMFLEHCAQEHDVAVKLIAADPSTLPLEFLPRGRPKGQILSIYYLSPAFFELLLATPSADHALFLGASSKLFTVSSKESFLLVFRGFVEKAARSGSPSFLQRLRIRQIPTNLFDASEFPIPDQHTLDPPAACTVIYFSTLGALLLSFLTEKLEELAYRKATVRFAPGQEPWKKWESAWAAYQTSHDTNSEENIAEKNDVGYLLGSVSTNFE